MEIHQINEIRKGCLEAIEDGKQAGKMTYTWAGDKKFIIDHTEVSREFNGKGVGKKLILYAADYARKNHLKIIPLCSFAKSVFDKTTEIQGVLSH